MGERSRIHSDHEYSTRMFVPALDVPAGWYVDPLAFCRVTTGDPNQGDKTGGYFQNNPHYVFSPIVLSCEKCPFPLGQQLFWSS